MANTTRSGTRMLGGSPEEPSGERRRPWWFRPALAAAALVLMLVVGAALVHSGHSPAPGAGSASAPSSVAIPGPAPGSGGSPVPVAAPVTSSVDPGAGRSVVDGVPVGYPRSRNGAVAAAVNFELARSRPDYFTDTATRHEVLRAMMAPSALAQEVTAEDQSVAQFLVSVGLDKPGSGGLLARASALGTRVDSYSSTVSTVEVWTCGIVGITSTNAPLPVSASWDTYTVTLVWQGGDWKVSAMSSVPGPTPLQPSSSDPSSVSDFNNANGAFDAPPYVG